MPPLSGRIGEIVWGKQASEGVGAASGTHTAPFAGGGLKIVQDIGTHEVTDPTSVEVVSEYKQQHAVGGSFSCIMTPTHPGGLFLAMMGVEALSGAADPYQHVFTFGEDSVLPWTTLFQTVGDQYHKFTDCKIASISLLWEAGRPVMLECEIRGKKGEQLASAYTTNPADSLDAAITMAGSDLYFDENITPPTTTHRNITRARVTLRRELHVQQTDNFTPQYIYAGRYGVDVEMDMWWEDAKAVKANYFGSTIGLTNSRTMVYGSAEFLSYAANNTTHNLRVAMRRMRLETELPESAQDGRPVTMTYRGRCVKPTSGSFVDVILKNARSSAY